MEDEEDEEDPLTDEDEMGKYVCNPHLITIAEHLGHGGVHRETNFGRTLPVFVKKRCHQTFECAPS